MRGAGLGALVLVSACATSPGLEGTGSGDSGTSGQDAAVAVSDVLAPKADSTGGEGCIADTECPEGLICCPAGRATGVCRTAVVCASADHFCEADSQCRGGETCCTTTSGNVCTAVDECTSDHKACISDADCPTGRPCCPSTNGMYCAPKGATCQDARPTTCATVADCAVGLLCCVTPHGSLCASTCGPSACTTDDDCIEDVCCKTFDGLRCTPKEMCP